MAQNEPGLRRGNRLKNMALQISINNKWCNIPLVKPADEMFCSALCVVDDPTLPIFHQLQSYVGSIQKFRLGDTVNDCTVSSFDETPVLEAEYVSWRKLQLTKA